jgi:hypothetical protein
MLQIMENEIAEMVGFIKPKVLKEYHNKNSFDSASKTVI